jgi:hypothetical protein
MRSFLNDIERITSKGYVPTDGGSIPSRFLALGILPGTDDILRTRVKTIAPTETILPNLEPGLEWRLCELSPFSPIELKFRLYGFR